MLKPIQMTPEVCLSVCLSLSHCSHNDHDAQRRFCIFAKIQFCEKKVEWGGLVAFASFPLKVLQKCVALLLRRLLPHASSSKTPLRNTKQVRWKRRKRVCVRGKNQRRPHFLHNMWTIVTYGTSNVLP